MLEAYSVAVRLTLLDSVSGVMLGLSDRFLAFNRTVGKSREEIKGLEADIKRLKAQLLLGGGLTALGVGGLSLMKGPIDEAKKFQTQVAQFQALGLGDTMNAEAMKFAQGMNVIGTSAVENMRLLREATTITNSLKDAEVMAPVMAKMRFGVQSVMLPDKADAFEDQLQAALKTTELRGALVNRQSGEIDPQRATQVMSGLLQAYIASGGLVKPSDYLAAIKTGGVSTKLMSDEMFMFGLGHFMQESGGSRTGTSAMSMFREMALGKMTQQAAEIWAKYGLLDPKAIHYGKTGHITKVDPMAALGADQAVHSPFEYINQVIVPQLQKKGLKGDDINIALAEMFQVRTASNLADQFVREQKIAQLYINRAKGAAGIDKLADIGSKTMAGQQIDLQAKWDNMMLDLGQTVLPAATAALEKFTAAIKGLTDAAKEHPAAAKAIEWGTLGALGLSAVGGIGILGSAAFRGLKTVLTLGGGVGGIAKLLGLGEGAAAGALGTGAAWVGGPLLAGLGSYGLTRLAGNLFTPKDWTLGGWLYDVMNPDAPKGAGLTANPNNKRGTIQRGAPSDGNVSPYISLNPKIQVTTPITVNVDGKAVYSAVVTRMGKEMAGPQTGSSIFDSSMLPTPAGGGF
jgi:hypothetical protein